MDFLWKKEPSGILIDIFANLDSSTLLRDVDFQLAVGVALNKKKNEHSTLLRESGNRNIKAKNWYVAMIEYNRSLRLAEINTENVSLVYANRSLCFLKMKMYDKCLIDIDLAIEAKYPQRLMSKLDERREFCLKELKNVSPIEIATPKLDFAADEKFPGMGNVLKMECNDKFGRHFIAKCDIDIGKTVMVEQPFVNSAILKMGCNVCDACLKNSTNFIACAKCTTALFCNPTCAEDTLHKIRCGRAHKDEGSLVEFTLRSIILCLNTFSAGKNLKLVDLWNFVEKAFVDRQKGKKVPKNLVDTKLKYRMFLELNLWLSKEDEENMIRAGYKVFHILMKLPGMQEWFNTRNQRFLMHLAVLHASLILCNSFQTEVNAGIFLLRNHLNHSCAPNVLCPSFQDKSIVITSRRIKKGEQLFTSYGKHYFFDPTEVRQEKLYKDFGFQCECEKCTNLNWPISSYRIKSDPDYQHLLAAEKTHICFDVSNTLALKKKCLEILIKYSGSVWCTELDMVSYLYEKFSTETMF